MWELWNKKKNRLCSDMCLKRFQEHILLAIKWITWESDRTSDTPTRKFCACACVNTNTKLWYRTVWTVHTYAYFTFRVEDSHIKQTEECSCKYARHLTFHPQGYDICKQKLMMLLKQTIFGWWGQSKPTSTITQNTHTHYYAPSQHTGSVSLVWQCTMCWHVKHICKQLIKITPRTITPTHIDSQTRTLAQHKSTKQGTVRHLSKQHFGRASSGIFH